jgi:hypothetical protein
VYLRDTGLLHHLLNLSSRDDVLGHPVAGPSFETFVLEDLIRREKLVRPHTQAFFWRTATGAEVDLVLDRGSARALVEVKIGRGDRPAVAQGLARSMQDIGAPAAWVIDQAPGVEAMGEGVERRSVSAALAWLPPEARTKVRQRGR